MIAIEDTQAHYVMKEGVLTEAVSFYIRVTSDPFVDRFNEKVCHSAA
jgi:hypothetical protein